MIAEIVYHIQQGPYWDWKVALDLFLGGAGVGALLLTILIDEGFKGKYKRICQTGAWISPILIIAGLILIMLKMGRPWVSYQTYLNYNPQSPLWWGSIFQPLVVLGGVIYAYLWISPEEKTPQRKTVGRILLPLTIIVGGYHGMLLAVMVSHPLWNTGPTVVSALLGFSSTGIAIVMLMHLWRMKLGGRLENDKHLSEFFHDMLVVRNALGVILVLQLATFFLWWLSLSMGNLQDQQALKIATNSYGNMLWGLGIGVGLILPLLLGLYVMNLGEEKHRKLQIHIIAWTNVLILIGSFFFRLALVLGGQEQLPINLAL